MHLRRHLLLKSLQLFDLLVIGGACALGIALYSRRMRFDLSEVMAFRLTLSNVLLAGLLLGLCHLVLVSAGLYQSRRLSTRLAEIRDIVKAVTLCALMLAAAAVVFNVESVTSRSFLATFWLGSTLILTSSRVGLRLFLAQLRRRQHNLRRVLIVGTNRRAAHIARHIEERTDLGYQLLGFADDPWNGLPALKAIGYRYPLVTDLRNLAQFLRETVIDEVFVCLPIKSQYERIQEILVCCESQGILVRLLGRAFDLTIARATAETFEDETILSLHTGRMEGWPVVAKRVVDVVGATALLIALSPLFLLTAVAIKLSSPGPVLFAQHRVGVSKRRFRMLKFRTMVFDAEHRQKVLERLNEVRGPAFKMRDDPRVTPIGRLLRKTSIDELPQLLNVVKGDMSLVGPRPLPLRDFNGFDADWHRRRFSVRPGLTCLWQVNGRSNVDFDAWMKLDMQYIDDWSLWLDLKILARTVPAVLRGSGAA
jgi:exopolysaccharide biosynthesis polyprenyl glycosylphosphotransferase